MHRILILALMFTLFITFYALAGTLETELVAAARAGDIGTVENLLDKGAKFLSDDLAIIDYKYAYCYPKRLNLFYYNFNLFPKIKKKLRSRQRFFVFISSVLGPLAYHVEDLFPIQQRYR